jgi:uncharacterized protein YxjI
MKQKLFSLGDDFYIQDESGQNVFFVDGKVFALGDHLSFQDLAGNELAFIRQKLLAWGPTYEIYRNGTLYATIKKEIFTFFHCRFSVDVPGPDDLEAEGDFLDHEYSFTLRDELSRPFPNSGFPGRTPTASRSPTAKTMCSSWPAPS